MHRSMEGSINHSNLQQHGGILMEPPFMTGYPKAHELMEKIMNAKINLPSMMIGVMACLLGVALFACDAAAQTAKDPMRNN